jgi:hypothetical protein
VVPLLLQRYYSYNNFEAQPLEELKNEEGREQ